MSNRIPPARHRERGFILILYALMMLFIIMPIVGLAIDAGILYMIKGKLQMAVDGAALGAARNLSANVSIDSQESTAGAAGIANFHANFPNNWMGVTPVNDPTVDWSQSTTSTAVVNITGTVVSPTWFMRILGFNSVTVTGYRRSDPAKSQRFVGDRPFIFTLRPRGIAPCSKLMPRPS